MVQAEFYVVPIPIAWPLFLLRSKQCLTGAVYGLLFLLLFQIPAFEHIFRVYAPFSNMAAQLLIGKSLFFFRYLWYTGNIKNGGDLYA